MASNTPTVAATNTPTADRNKQPDARTSTSTATSTLNPTSTATNTPLATSTPTLTPTASPTASTTATASATVTATAVPQGPISLSPVSDTYSTHKSPTQNNGTSGTLWVDGDSGLELQTYIRFSISGLTQSVSSAKLWLYVNNGSNGGPSVFQTSPAWSETGLTWNTAPGPIGNALSTVQTLSGSTWVSFDVSAAITGNGDVAFVLLPNSIDAAGFNSRESATNRPRLDLTLGSPVNPTATSIATVAPSATFTPAATATSTPTASSTATPTSTSTTSPATSTATSVSTATQTGTATATSSGTAVPTATVTGTVAVTMTGTATTTPSATATNTASATSTASATATRTATATPSVTPTATPPSGSVVVMAAGDIVCGQASTNSWCKQAQTAAVIQSANPDAVLALGDVQYECAEMADFRAYFDPTWGQFKGKIHPTSGNHEYKTGAPCVTNKGDAAEYYAYFGSLAGDPSKGYYSFNLGAWHIVALNSNCSVIGGCGAGSPQETWLRGDLAANPRSCTLAYMHYPRYSSVAPFSSLTALWQALYDNGAEIVLAAHDHHYERYGPRNATGGSNPTNGIVEFIVGTGGKQPNQSFGSVDTPVATGTVPGVLKLTLAGPGTPGSSCLFLATRITIPVRARATGHRRAAPPVRGSARPAVVTTVDSRQQRPTWARRRDGRPNYRRVACGSVFGSRLVGVGARVRSF